jgi:hypothetical protein
MFICAGCQPLIYVATMVASLENGKNNLIEEQFYCTDDSFSIQYLEDSYYLKGHAEVPNPNYFYNFEYNKKTNTGILEFSSKGGMALAMIDKLEINEKIEDEFSKTEKIQIQITKKFNWGIGGFSCKIDVNE